jgi:hypothetical protein
MHKAAVPDRCEQKWKSKIETQHARAQTALRDVDGMPGPECDIVKYPTILAQRNFAFSTSIKVIKYRFRYPFTGDGTEVLDAYNLGRRYSSGGSRHAEGQYIQEFQTGRYRTTSLRN